MRALRNSHRHAKAVTVCAMSFYPFNTVPSPPNRHLLVAISSHGFGHLAQVAPILNALHNNKWPSAAPTFDLTVRSALSAQQIATRVQRAFEVDPGTDDFGMIMRDALHIDLPASLAKYAQTHRQWDALIEERARHLTGLNVNALLADAPYLTLAAAKAANIPCAAICSLNWADILERCVKLDKSALTTANVSSPTLDRILQQMRDAYGAANLIMRPTPAIETTGFDYIDVDPIVDKPQTPDRDALLALVREQTGVAYAYGATATSSASPWLVLASMGGIGLTMDTAHWPTQWAGRPIVYLVDKALMSGQTHTVALDVKRLSFEATLAACDLVLTKPGYGMFVEAAAHGKPLLFLSRNEWPESECLTQWAQQQLPCHQITLDAAARGSFTNEISDLLSRGPVTPRVFDGAIEAATHLAQWLGQVWHDMPQNGLTETAKKSTAR